MNKKYFLLSVLLAMVGGTLFLSSCKSTKKLSTRHLKTVPFDVLYAKMEKQVPSFTWFAAKMGVYYQKADKDPVNFRVQIRMKKDSIIWMSLIPAMGIEAARVVMTKDSVKLLNRLKKNYLLGTYHLLDSLMHTKINYDMIQALLFARVVHYPVVDSSASVTPDGYLLTMTMPIPVTDNQRHTLTQKVWLDPDSYRVKSLLLQESSMKGKDIRIFYDAYQTVSGQTLPQKMRIVIQANQKIEIDITYKKVETGVPHHFPFIVPEKYKKLL